MYFLKRRFQQVAYFRVVFLIFFVIYYYCIILFVENQLQFLSFFIAFLLLVYLGVAFFALICYN